MRICRAGRFDGYAVIAAAIVAVAMVAGLLAAKAGGVKISPSDMVMIDAAAGAGVLILHRVLAGRR